MNWDPRLTQLGLTVEPADRTKAHWRMVAAWLTVAGNWDGVPDFARPYQQDVLGGDHHVFGMALDTFGNPISDAGFVMMWADGGDQRTPVDCGRPDWADLPIYAGYDWAQTSGPYTWQKFGNADKLCGVGLPYPPLPWQPQGDAYPAGGVHVSFFYVAQATDAEVDPPPPPPPPPPKPGWRCTVAGWLRAWAEKLCPGEDVGAWMWDVSDEALRIEMANWGD